jgi:hypothetical protein
MSPTSDGFFLLSLIDPEDVDNLSLRNVDPLPELRGSTTGDRSRRSARNATELRGESNSRLDQTSDGYHSVHNLVSSRLLSPDVLLDAAVRRGVPQ